MDHINYHLILAKYIKYVKEAEGVDFISNGKDFGTDVKFTEQEWEVLCELSTKLNFE